MTPTQSIAITPLQSADMHGSAPLKKATVTLIRPTADTSEQFLGRLMLHPDLSTLQCSLDKVYAFASESFNAQSPFRESVVQDMPSMRCFTSPGSATIYLNCPESDSKQNDDEGQSERKIEREGSTKQFSKAVRLNFSHLQPPELEIVACLQIKPALNSQDDALSRMQNEIDLLNQLRGKEHICHLYDGQIYDEVSTINDEEKTEKKAVQYQKLYDHDVDEMIGTHPLNQQPLLNNFIEHLLKALIDLHNQNILHLDLKFKNIFFSEINQKFYLSDFDLSASTSKMPDVCTGTPAFLSPELFAKWCGKTINILTTEILATDSYGVGTDLWSLGIMLLHLTNPDLGSPPLTSLLDNFNTAYTTYTKDYSTATDQERSEILEAEYKMDDIILEYSQLLNVMHQEPAPRDPLKGLIWGLLRPLQSERLTAKEALEFFNEQIKVVSDASVNLPPTKADRFPTTPSKAATNYLRKATFTTPLKRLPIPIPPRTFQGPVQTPNGAGSLVSGRSNIGAPIPCTFDSPAQK